MRASAKSLPLKLIAALGLMVPVAAHAELPAVKLLSAPLATPSGAWSYYGSGTVHTTGVIGWTAANRPAEIKELARALSQGGALTGSAYADRVFEHVRSNIKVEHRFGLAKGARGALIDQSGTPFDQAHLMIELLREGGVSASYQVGTISPSAAQFAEWTGLTDAKAACQFLADGAIPATVNGASSCSGLSGSLSSVTLGHIWVSAAGKLYDPSFKKHLFKTGIDLAAALGCGNAAAATCGSTIVGLVPAPALRSGTTNVYQIASVPESSINAQLKTWSVNLQNYIQNYNAANHTFLSVEDVIGGKLIDQTNPVPSATLPYGSSVQYTWTGEIPDQFRTTLRVQLDGLDQTLFADELAGKRLRIWGDGTQFNNGTNTYTRTAALYVEYKPLAKSTRANSTSNDAILTLTVNHPYAANSGGYMDDTLQRNTDFGLLPPGTNVLTILNGWGDASPSSINHFAALQSRDQNNLQAQDISDPNHLWFRKPASDPVEGHTFNCFRISPSNTPVADSGCFQQHHATSAATWLAQASRMTGMAAQIGGGLVQLHHSIGFLLSGEGHPVTVISSETSLSANSKASVAADRQAISFTVAAGLSRLEGSVFEQEFDAWDGGSAVSYLVKSSSSSGKGIATLWVDSGNVTQALNALTNYSATRKATLQSYISAGYRLMVPQNGYLGSYTYCCQHTLGIESNATVGFSTAGDRAAYLIDGRFKGSAAGASLPSEEALNSVEVMNYSLRNSDAYRVNQADGSFTLSPPPDLITGAGGFPFSLPYQRHYSSSADIDALDDSTGASAAMWQPYQSFPSGQTVSHLGGGWSHNYDISARMASDGFKGLGMDSAREASAAIASLFTVYRLNAGATSFASHMATTYATNWWIARLQNNVVVVRRPPATSVFTRLPDDSTFSAPPGSSDVLTQSGNRVFKTWAQGSLGSLYNYNGTGFTLTDGAGQVTQLSYLTTDFHNQNFAVPTALTAAQGVRLSFANKGMNTLYTDCTWQRFNCLSSVSNSLGRSLSLSPSTVSDDNGRQISFRTEHNSSGSTIADTTNTAIYWVPSKFIVTGLGGLVTSYQYVANPLTAIERPFPRIYRWYTPSSSTTPYITADYDAFYRVKGVTDTLSHRTDYYVSALYGSETRKSGAVRDPLGNVTTAIFGGGSELTSITDPLGRTSTKVYDQANRVIREVMPEGDAIEYQYDIRSNRTRECRIAKGRVIWSSLNAITEQVPQCNSSAGDLVTTTAYMEGPTVWPCVNAKTCNKPSYVIDPRGNRTDYTWSTLHGQMLTETKPADAAGVRPVTTLGYTAFTGTDGATFHLLTSKQEKIDATTTTTTTFEYDATNHWSLKSQIVDSGGLGLRTCFKFDAVGNLISMTEPRAGLGTCT